MRPAAVPGVLYRGFGSWWSADLPLAEFDRVAPSDERQVTNTIRVHAAPTPTDRVPVRNTYHGYVYADGFHFRWRDEATFDYFDDGRLVYSPGVGWTGTLPFAFFSSVAALTLAWRGNLPLHTSCVEMGGKAILLMGSAGAGKSTLAAALLGRGARLVADDLTVLDSGAGAAPATALRGRPTIRLHAETALSIPAHDRHAVLSDPRGKWLVRPLARTESSRIPVAGAILLGQPDDTIPALKGAAVIGQHLFRPQWFQALPGQAARLRAVMTLAARTPLHGLVTLDGFHRDDAAIDRALAIITTMTTPS